MHRFNRLLCIILVLATASTHAQPWPDQASTDSLLSTIDVVAEQDYTRALRMIDSASAVLKDQPTYITPYLNLQMKKSGVLLKAKAHSKAFATLLAIEGEVSKHPDVLVRGLYQVMTAFVYGDQGNFTTAMECYQNALTLYEGVHDYRRIAITYNNMADAYLVDGRYEKAREEISKALLLYSAHPFSDGSALFSTAGEIELAMKQYQKALFYFNHAFLGADSLNPRPPLTNATGNVSLARALIGLKQFDKAKWHIDRCKSKISNDQGLAFRYYLTLVDFFKAMKKFDSALYYNEAAFQLSRRLAAEKAIEEIEMVRLNERYESENVLLRQQVGAKSFQQKLYLIIVLLAMLSVGFLAYAIIIKRRDYRLLQQQNDEIAAQAEELRAITDELATQGEALRMANEALEAKVNERTAKLRAKNEQLTKYAFFNAHKLRSPVATLLGLKELLAMSHTQEEKQKIVGHILTTTERFDEVVRETQKLLENVDEEPHDDRDTIPKG
ncbi:MAG: tetratricopeptide repeat protein [Bacteroidota bacterium]